MVIDVQISPAELIDKLTILETKLEYIRDPAKLANVRYEYDLLSRICQQSIVETDVLVDLRRQLKETNKTIWRVEDGLREHERRRDFGTAFIELARLAYLSNDARSAAKRRINEILDSTLMEEKSHAD
jgi:hypothetical protein